MQESIWTDPPVLAAIITGSVALILALWNFFSGRKSQKEIEVLKNELAEKKSENDARREYEFEARKRLYQEYEPLLFQLMETSGNALQRIKSLARTAREGNLNKTGWLSDFSYYTSSTLYKLFVPLAVYQIMQKKLTLIDITVDRSIGLRYKLAKQIYLLFADDFEIAKKYKKIIYNPNDRQSLEKRELHPINYWRQGLPIGFLDKTIDILIEKDDNGKERIISFGEFERKLENPHNDKTSGIQFARDIFFNFHPKERPVLWRILIAQFFLLKALLELKSIKSENITESLIRDLLIKYNKNDISSFLWSNNETDSVEIEEPFKAAVEYFKERF